MRPEIVFPLFAPVRSLPGIGPRLASLLSKITGPNIIDLCWHLPSGIVDRRYAPKVADAIPGLIATMTIEIFEHQPPKIRKLPYKIICGDESGKMELVFFHAREDYLIKVLPVGKIRVVSGKIESFKNKIN